MDAREVTVKTSNRFLELGTLRLVAPTVYVFFKEFRPLSLAALNINAAFYSIIIRSEFPALHDNNFDNVLLSP